VSTEDGSPVEVYRRLPAMGEPELAHALFPGGRVLDLGAGTGRIADPLVALGHDVLAVDGRVLLQWHEPAWFDRLSPGARLDGAIGPLSSTLEVHDLAGGVLSATVTYRDGARVWAQAFRAARLALDDLDAELGAAGLRRLPPAPAESWAVAQRQR